MTAWVLITGATEGLGREFATIAAREGHDLILSARRQDALERIAAELSAAHGIAAVALAADLSEPGAAARLWDRAAEGRRIGILVNNAGLGHNGRFAEGDGAREEASIAVNVTAATVLMKRAAAHMAQAGAGRILNVASTAAFMPGPHMAVYHATKAYLLSLSQAVAEELRGSGVTVTALCPGATRTNFFADAGMEKATLLNRMPLPSARGVAEAGWRAMLAGRRIRVTGVDNKLYAAAARLAPGALTTRLAALMLARRG